MPRYLTVVPPDAHFDLYVADGRKKPRLVGTFPANKVIPSVMKIEGVDHYFGEANLTKRTLTYLTTKGEAK